MASQQLSGWWQFVTLQFLQRYPRLLEIIYDGTHLILKPFKRWLKPGARLEGIVTWGEELGKRSVFDCQMCGQCILHSTGMTCSMTCPKNLRNGACGGVRTNGHCEVNPDMRCVWVDAYERSLKMSVYGHEMLHIQPPVNRQLEGKSAWINMLHDIDANLPDGWVKMDAIPVINLEDIVSEKTLWTSTSSREAA